MRFTHRALLVGALMLAATTARATPARVVGLGDLGRYVEDDTNVLLYPGLIGRHTNFVWVDLAPGAGAAGVSPTLPEQQSSTLNGGAFIRLTDALSLGIMASDYAPGEHAEFLRQVGAASEMGRTGNRGSFEALSGLEALRRYDLLVGYSLSRDLGLGLRLSYGGVGQSYVPDEDDQTVGDNPERRKTDSMGQQQIRATAGLSGLLADGTAYDVALDYANYAAWYRKNEEHTFQGGGGHGVGVNARMRFVLSRYWDLIPQVSYRGQFFGLEEDSTMPEFGENGRARVERLKKRADGSSSYNFYGRNQHTIDVGAAGALRASKVATFWLATGIEWNGVFDSADIATNDIELLAQESSHTLALPYVKFAVEATPLEWLRLRIGAEKYSFSASGETFVEDIKEKRKTREGGSELSPLASRRDFAAYIGASAVVEGFQADLLLENEFLRRGPNFLSGAGGNIAARASLSYRF